MKNNKLLILLTLLLGASLVNNKQPVKASAEPEIPIERPTTIDMTLASDATLSNFYAGVEGKSGEDLLEVLYHKIKDHREYNFESVAHREIFKIIERNWDLDPVNPVGFDYKNDNGYLRKLYGDYNDDVGTAYRFYDAEKPTNVSFDKEHIWPQTYGDFGRTFGAGSDFHALWASDQKINRQGHNDNHYAEPILELKDRPTDFGSIGGRTGRLVKGGPLVFEPLDEYKGDIARAMFYMPARYFEHIDQTHPKLELVNGTPTTVASSFTTSGKAGDLETLLEWHELDPVDDYEIQRNNLIYNNYQLNRNPFIDYPQWARIAYDPNYTGAGASNEIESSSVGANSDPFSNATLSELTINTDTVKKDYLKNEPFSTNGLVVTASYDNGEQRRIKKYDINIPNGTVLDTPGANTIEISLTHGAVTLTKSFTVNVSTHGISDYLFISEAYGGGSNSGSTYSHDFVELYNHSDEPISLNGISIQQASQSSSTWYQHNLNGEIASKSYFLIQMKVGGTSVPSFELPFGDNVSTLEAAATSFKFALVNGTRRLSGMNPSNEADIIDFVGTGASVNGFYIAKAPTPSVSNSVTRIFENGAPLQNKNNSLDYVATAPTPMNSALSLAHDIMAFTDENTMECLINYAPIKTKVLNLSVDLLDDETGEVDVPGQLTYFKTGSGDLFVDEKDLIVDGRARYEAWAFFNNDETPYEPNVVEVNERAPINNGEAAQTMIVLVISLLAMSLFVPLFIRKQPN